MLSGLTDLATLPGWLRSLAPGSQAALVAVDQRHLTSLQPIETAAVERAVAKRQIQFASGRVAAHDALARLGRGDCELPVGTMREPVWPAAIIGAISHCDRWALAWVAHRHRYAGLGIDLERPRSLPANAWAIVLSVDEQRWAGAQSDSEMAATTLFSIKESIYKAVFPTVGRFVDFDEVELNVDPAGQLTVTPATRLAVELTGYAISAGLAHASAERVASWALLCSPADQPDSA